MPSRKIKICKEMNCHNAQTSAGYCRLHYLKNWKTIKEGEKEKAAERLNKYVEGICKRNPDDYLSTVKRDIHTDKIAVDNTEGLALEDDVESLFSDIDKDEASLDKLLVHMRIHDKF